jgi:hypothetical protein
MKRDLKNLTLGQKILVETTIESMDFSTCRTYPRLILDSVTLWDLSNANTRKKTYL